MIIDCTIEHANETNYGIMVYRVINTIRRHKELLLPCKLFRKIRICKIQYSIIQEEKSRIMSLLKFINDKELIVKYYNT